MVTHPVTMVTLRNTITLLSAKITLWPVPPGGGGERQDHCMKIRCL